MSPLGSSLVQSILPTIAVAVVTVMLQRRSERQIEKLRAQLLHRGGYLARKLKAHEEVWPLMAKCHRAQESLTAARKDNRDLRPLAEAIAAARAELKNYVYDHGLYFDEETRHLVQDLDTALASPAVDDVRNQMVPLEAKLRNVIDVA